MSILEIKKSIYQKIKNIYKEDHPIHSGSDEELHKCIHLQVVDNLPMHVEGKYNRRKAQCEYCHQSHGQADTCDLKLDKLSANSEEGSKQIKLRDVIERMEHKRDLILGVIFRESSGAQMKYLEPEFDQSHIKDLTKKDKETISLSSCFQAFSREELLTGADQWYCNKCQEQRDIHKRLELFKAPKILIIQLKRFQSKKSSSKQSGFIALAYAQICQ